MIIKSKYLYIINGGAYSSKRPLLSCCNDSGATHRLFFHSGTPLQGDFQPDIPSSDYIEIKTKLGDNTRELIAEDNKRFDIIKSNYMTFFVGIKNIKGSHFDLWSLTQPAYKERVKSGIQSALVGIKQVWGTIACCLQVRLKFI